MRLCKLDRVDGHMREEYQRESSERLVLPPRVLEDEEELEHAAGGVHWEEHVRILLEGGHDLREQLLVAALARGRLVVDVRRRGDEQRRARHALAADRLEGRRGEVALPQVVECGRIDDELITLHDPPDGAAERVPCGERLDAHLGLWGERLGVRVWG